MITGDKCELTVGNSVMQGRPSLQQDHADCVGPHLAEGASSCGGSLILRREPQLSRKCVALMQRNYCGSARFRRCEAPLAPRPRPTPRRCSRNRGPHHITLRGASSWPGTALVSCIASLFTVDVAGLVSVFSLFYTLDPV